MSKQFNVEIVYRAKVVVRVNAETEGEAKGLTEKYSTYESTVLMGNDEGHAETITCDQDITVIHIDEYTTPDQFEPERREPLNLKMVEMLRDVLEEQIGVGAEPLSNDYYGITWQQHLKLSDAEFEELQKALPRLSLSDEEGGEA